ncbi:hypothetical protein ABIB17_002007 [Arthrobacter sp. UYEF6]
MSPSRWRLAAAAIALVLATTACGVTQPDRQPTATNEHPPTATHEPAPTTFTPPAPAPEAAPCPVNWPQRYEYGGTVTSYYPLADDYRQHFSGFNLCYSPATAGWVLYNNTKQVWSFLPGTAVQYAVAPTSDSISTLFHQAFTQQPAIFVVPGEIVQFAEGWPPNIAWAPDPGLTAAWLAQSLALEHLEFNAKSGNLTKAATEFIRTKQLQTTNPAGAALLGCAKSGYEATSGAAALNDTSELLDRLKVGLDGTKGATSCISSIRKLFIDETQGSTDWVARVNRTTAAASDSVDAVQALKPILQYCEVVRFIPKLANLLRGCR